MQTIYKLLAIACLSGLVACGNNDNTNQNNTNNDKDMTVDMVDMTQDDTPDICTPKTVCDENVCGLVADGCGGNLDCGGPITECPVDSCGMVPDGCGGNLDCGECVCIDNVPQKASCDACGVFLLTCQGSQGACGSTTIQPILDLTEQDCDNAIMYVDSQAAGGGDGSKDRPFTTLTDAMTAATGNTKAILLKGDATYTGTINLKDGVSILGGYGADWSIDQNLVPTIEGDAPADEDVFGLKADSIDIPTIISNVIIRTPDAQNGHDNYALWVKDSPKLVLHKVNTFAGAGGRGENGVAGKVGDRGIDGTAGRAGEGKFRFTLGVVTYPFVDTLLSNEGVNTNCPDSAGGRGGAGGWETNAMARLAEKGGDALQGTMGGAAGVNDASMTRLAGKDGEVGLLGPTARPGKNGEVNGVVVDGLYKRDAPHGEIGETGATGPGGGGGGGAAHSISGNNNEVVLAGPQGGGGGSGGCGGTGGTGGKAGGSSFGLFVVSSNGIQTISSSFTAGAGGIGGDGGEGGAGGAGGQGGDPTSRNFSMQNGMAVNEGTPSSGRGGKGSKGQQGGAGGAGVGGASFGAFCWQTKLADTDSRFKAAFASKGGTSPSGQNAPEGPSEDNKDCK